ncbi:MAG: hypothetical protein ABIF77_19500 [bacterium]
MFSARNAMVFLTACCLPLIVFLVAAPAARAAGKVGLYGLYMEPHNNDAEDYSNAGWGGGVRLVVPAPVLGEAVAGVIGFEVINLLAEVVEVRDRYSPIRYDLHTNQNYFRFYFGGEIGGHGPAFFRPYAGLKVALVVYSIDSYLEIPDDYDPDNSVRQDLDSDTEANFGYDLTLGADLQVSKQICIDGGVRYVKSFGVPQQLRYDAIEIHPDYFQIFLGIGISLSAIGE